MSTFFAFRELPSWQLYYKMIKMETNTNSKQLKKFAILFATFVVPLLFFLFLASGKVNFNKLPVLTERVQNIPARTSVSLYNKVSVVSAVGSDSSVDAYQKVLNLYQVVYKYAAKYEKFQIVTLVPDTDKSIIDKLQKELALVGGVSLKKWHFVVLSVSEIDTIVNSFESKATYDLEEGISEVFVVDEQLNLRGRTDDEDTESGVLFGYNAGEVAVLKNKLRDDLDVVFYESIYAVKE